MEAESKSNSSLTTDREQVKFNKQLLIYLFFLVVAICFWYLNALSKDYTTVVNYAVKFTDFPKGKVLVSDMPDKIGLKVKGFGLTFLNIKS